MSKAIRVGITGGIGSGKTTVGNYLKEKGYAVYDCDEIARAEAETVEVQTAIRKAFGDRFFKDGRLERKALGDYAFADLKRTEKLNSIFHNAIKNKVDSIISLYVTESVFVIAPLLFEAQMNTMFDECWVVATTEKKQRERVLARDNMSEEQFFNRLQRQMPLDKRLGLADRIINNNLTIDDLKAETDEILMDAFKPKPDAKATNPQTKNMLFSTGTELGGDEDD